MTAEDEDEERMLCVGPNRRLGSHVEPCGVSTLKRLPLLSSSLSHLPLAWIISEDELENKSEKRDVANCKLKLTPSAILLIVICLLVININHVESTTTTSTNDRYSQPFALHLQTQPKTKQNFLQIARGPPPFAPQPAHWSLLYYPQNCNYPAHSHNGPHYHFNQPVAPDREHYHFKINHNQQRGGRWNNVVGKFQQKIIDNSPVKTTHMPTTGRPQQPATVQLRSPKTNANLLVARHELNLFKKYPQQTNSLNNFQPQQRPLTSNDGIARNPPSPSPLAVKTTTTTTTNTKTQTNNKFNQNDQHHRHHQFLRILQPPNLPPDIDECLDERACGKGALCVNLPGSFRCACPAGFTGDPMVECIGK